MLINLNNGALLLCIEIRVTKGQLAVPVFTFKVLFMRGCMGLSLCDFDINKIKVV